MLDLTQCFFIAAQQYQVDPYLLMAIAKVESGFNPRALNKNKNGTVDRGIMQINSVWDKHLVKYGIDPKWVWHPCYNVSLGAMVLRHCQDRYKYVWKAVDCYNKGGKAQNTSHYVWKVYHSYRTILQQRAMYPSLLWQVQ